MSFVLSIFAKTLAQQTWMATTLYHNIKWTSGRKISSKIKPECFKVGGPILTVLHIERFSRNFHRSECSYTQ